MGTREIYKDDFTEYLLCLALDVGEGMLKNGGEVGRVEDTIERICKAYGAQHVEVFTIVSMINAAIRMPDGSYSLQLRRVKQTGNNLGMLESLNALSREICATTPDLDDFERKLRDIKKRPVYPKWLQMLASAAGAAVFCLLFGGGILESCVTFGIGLLIYFTNNFRSKRLNAMARTVIGAFLATVIAALFNKLVPSVNVDYIIIGAIMLLVPGLFFVTAVRDLFCGDLLAGTLKILQAILQVMMIGFGYMLAFAMVGDILIMENVVHENHFIVQLVAAVLSAVTFAVVFKTDKRHLISAGVCGLITYAVYFGVLFFDGSLFFAAFASSVAAAIYSELNARVVRVPAIVVMMPGVISIVPGGYLYRAARDFINGTTSGTVSELAGASAIALGLAGGIVVSSLILGIIFDWIKILKRSRNVNKNEQKEGETVSR